MAEKTGGLASFVTSVGMRSVQAVRETGYLAALLVESFYWLLAGFRRRQPVRTTSAWSPWPVA